MQTGSRLMACTCSTQSLERSWSPKGKVTREVALELAEEDPKLITAGA